MENSDFIKELLESRNTAVLTSVLLLPDDLKAMETTRLSRILNMEEARIYEDGQKVLDILENDEDYPSRELYIQLKWKVLALVTVQDVFSGVVFSDMKPEEFGDRNYFYYESLHLLREYFYCGFNNFLSASQHLLRTILEFNIKQIYFDYTCMSQESHAPLRKYLKDGISTDPAKMINRFLPNNDSAKPLKKQIQLVLKGLSGSSSHAYTPLHSVRGNGKMHHEYSIDSLFFWATLHVLLDSILWMYYFYYPQLFNPKDVARKFGFSPPVGCFISKEQHFPIKHSLKKRDYVFFKDRALNSDVVLSLNQFYDSQKDMSDKEILESWDEKGAHMPGSINEGYNMTITKMRAMQEILANTTAVNAFDNQSNYDKMQKLFDAVDNYNWWKSNYKKF